MVRAMPVTHTFLLRYVLCDCPYWKLIIYRPGAYFQWTKKSVFTCIRNALADLMGHVCLLVITRMMSFTRHC